MSEDAMVRALIAATVIVVGLATLLIYLVALAYRTDWRSFLDRPLCFVLGHPYEGRYIGPTNWTGRPADMIQCARCGHVVIVVRPEPEQVVGRIRKDGGWDRRYGPR